MRDMASSLLPDGRIARCEVACSWLWCSAGEQEVSGEKTFAGENPASKKQARHTRIKNESRRPANADAAAFIFVSARFSYDGR